MSDLKWFTFLEQAAKDCAKVGIDSASDYALKRAELLAVKAYYLPPTFTELHYCRGCMPLTQTQRRIAAMHPVSKLWSSCPYCEAKAWPGRGEDWQTWCEAVPHFREWAIEVSLLANKILIEKNNGFDGAKCPDALSSKIRSMIDPNKIPNTIEEAFEEAQGSSVLEPLELESTHTTEEGRKCS